MRILIAEDDAISRRLLQATLTRHGYEVITASDGQAAWEVLQAADAPGLAILDWMMPGMDGPQICREVRRRGDQAYVYLLLLTACDRKQDIVEGLKAGADDYLVKPFDAFELKARLDVGRRVLDLQRQLLAAYEEMRHRATHDPLTGISNRGAILEALHYEWLRLEREGGSLGLLMADIDHFKRINDTYGHPAGDTVLREVARRMAAALRGYDRVGRYGGEEFLVLLPRLQPELLQSLAERLREAVAANPISLGGHALEVTLSIGASYVEEARESTTQRLLLEADTALYEAKRAGRNRVVFRVSADVAQPAITA
jgi:diguanylate cyclase (GGDEF)-like protein